MSAGVGWGAGIKRVIKFKTGLKPALVSIPAVTTEHQVRDSRMALDLVRQHRVLDCVLRILSSLCGRELGAQVPVASVLLVLVTKQDLCAPHPTDTDRQTHTHTFTHTRKDRLPDRL